MLGIAEVFRKLQESRGPGIPCGLMCKECGYLSYQRRKWVGIWIKARRPDLLRSDGEIPFMSWCECYRNELEVEAGKVQIFREANLPIRNDEKGPRTWANFVPTDLTAVMQRAVADFAVGKGPPALTLVGITGCGKTHLMEAAARDMLASGLRVRYERVSDLTDRLKHTFSRSSEENDIFELVNWYRAFSVLILDDLSMTPPSEWEAGQITRLVDARNADGARLLVATNFKNAEEVATGALGAAQGNYSRGWGPRLGSRLFDVRTGTVRAIWCGAPDYRLKGEQS